MGSVICALYDLLCLHYRLPVNYYLMNFEAHFYGYRGPPGREAIEKRIQCQTSKI
jgi:hypothetical protein